LKFLWQLPLFPYRVGTELRKTVKEIQNELNLTAIEFQRVMNEGSDMAALTNLWMSDDYISNTPVIEQIINNITNLLTIGLINKMMLFLCLILYSEMKQIIQFRQKIVICSASGAETDKFIIGRLPLFGSRLFFVCNNPHQINKL